MTVLSFPAGFKPSRAEFGLVSNTQGFVSPLAATVQTVELPGARWRCRMTFENLSDADGRTLKAFLTKLNGMAGRFYYGDPSFLIDGPQGALGGTPLVNGASQTGNTLNVDGWSASVTDILKAGDYIQFTNADGGRELKMITADVSSNGSGETALEVYPAIRVSPADNAAITVTGATCQMMLNSDAADWALRRPMLNTITIDAIEAFTDAA